jgi:hypothetical protein
MTLPTYALSTCHEEGGGGEEGERGGVERGGVERRSDEPIACPVYMRMLYYVLRGVWCAVWYMMYCTCCGMFCACC